MNAWRIVLADDHQMVRAGLRLVLENELPCRVVAEAATGDEAVAYTQQQQPDVLVTDLVMPGQSGLEVIRQVHQLVPRTRIVVFSMYADERYVREALQSGALAYVLKESMANELVTAVRDVIAGQRYLSQALARRVIEAYAQPTALDPYDTLTRRERAVLTLVAMGLTSGAIAAQLGISARTVDGHRTNVLRKLGLR
ncbi:MAG: response regulator transcription factor, partial [Chloroflexales bacterium]